VDSYEENRDELLQRLRKIEGQVRGVQKMIEDGRYCIDVLTQLAAISQGIRRVSMMVSEAHARGCLEKALKEEEGEEAVRNLVHVLFRFTR